MPRKKFLRRNWSKASRLGKGRKKKQTWRRATGRHSKIRLKRKGYPTKVMVGFKQSEKAKPAYVSNFNELNNAKRGDKIILGKMGKKKKIEMVKAASEKGIIIANLNSKALKEIMGGKAK